MRQHETINCEINNYKLDRFYDLGQPNNWRVGDKRGFRKYFLIFLVLFQITAFNKLTHFCEHA